MSSAYDVIVLGLGAMGSAATYQLAKSNVKVLGIDQFSPPHIFGSTHGDTRITRQAIGEGEYYVPIVLRSYEIWEELEKISGLKLLEKCGGLIMADQRSSNDEITNTFLKTTIAAAEKYKIAHQILNRNQIRERFPQFSPTDTTVGYFERDAGYLRPEKCVEVQLLEAEKLGAEIHTNEKILMYEIDDLNGQVKVITDKDTYEAEKIIVTVGPWLARLLNEEKYKDIFKIYRQVLYWFEIEDEKSPLLDKSCPIYIWEYDGDPEDNIYGFPAIDGLKGGVKIASEKEDLVLNPDEVNRQVSEEELKYMYSHSIKNKVVGLKDKCVRAVTCLYTVTPDHDFVIDFHPQHQNVIVASPCSGHGFKHSAAIGEILSELVTKGKSSLDISHFALSRFK